VVEDYPIESDSDKLLVPYIEKYNGNIRIKEEAYVEAIEHYNKSLIAMKKIFEIDVKLI